MKPTRAKFLYLIGLLATTLSQAQHAIKLNAVLDPVTRTLSIDQELTYSNQSQDTISTLVLNDWMNSYSEKNSYLGKRFSDEFVRSFHFATRKELGGTSIISISDDNNRSLNWNRPENQVDLLEVVLADKILPLEKRTLHLKYQVKIPHDRFTRYGYDDRIGGFVLKDWYLVPARYEKNQFTRYSNADTDDIANSLCDYDLQLTLPNDFQITTDLNEVLSEKSAQHTTYQFSGNNRIEFSLFVDPKSNFYSFKNEEIEVITNLKDNGLTDIQKALMIERVISFARANLGKYPFQKITVSEVDYERNPFYGLNQLPSFINVFQDEFLFELKFLKTYLNNYLKNTMLLDRRKDNWIFDGMQVYLMMKYVEENRPGMKMLGGISKLKLLKSYNIVNLDFNGQYSYLYLFMARRNLDQPLSDPKDALIRFNEKIASKYKAGLSLNYLDHYLGSDIVPRALQSFYNLSTAEQTTSADFQRLMRKQTNSDLNWFFQSVVGTRDLIDFSFKKVVKSKDSITFTIKNKTGTNVPIPVYGLKGKNIVFKNWYENIRKDSTFTVARQDADKIVINHESEVPEFNRRNNYESLHSWFGNNRPFKFVLLKDLEDPSYNQITYVPSITYNLYDGLSPGFRFSNRTLLNKPFIYEINPVYSSNTGSLRGLSSFSYNQLNRNSNLFYIRYALSASYFNYAPDATFYRISPIISLNFRDSDLRKNDRKFLTLRYNVVQKQESKLVLDNTLKNYSIFNLKFGTGKQELVHVFSFSTDTQISSSFGRVASEINFRRLIGDSRQFNFRLFAGSILYDKSTTNTFFFGVSKINDYLFEQELLGRSEKSGIFSQQFIMGDGGFKSKVLPESVNKWLITSNMGFNIWNWIEVYGDVGVVKNNNIAAKFIYDNGIRLNLVPDYFELYLPVYSNNGWEIAQDKYGEKIRIVFTIDPKLLLNLFTRKWF